MRSVLRFIALSRSGVDGLPGSVAERSEGESGPATSRRARAGAPARREGPRSAGGAQAAQGPAHRRKGDLAPRQAVPGEPAGLRHVAPRRRPSAQARPVHEGEDVEPSGAVAVGEGADEPADARGRPELLADLPPQAGLGLLARLEEAPGQVPRAGVWRPGPPREEDAAPARHHGHRGGHRVVVEGEAAPGTALPAATLLGDPGERVAAAETVAGPRGHHPSIAQVDTGSGPGQVGGSMAARWLEHLKGDLAGGLTAALLTIPVSVGYGILALSPLGDEYVNRGAQAGLWCAILVPIVGVLLGAETTLMYAPRSVVAFLIGSLAVHNLGGAGLLAPGDVPRTLALVFFVVFLVGVFQAVMGAFRLGGLVRYVPFPVMAGFQNAAAVLIFFSQLPALLGIARAVPPQRLLEHLGAARPLTLVVGLVTALAMWYGPRVTARVPPAIAGLAAGSAAYYALAAVGLGADLGPTIGRLPSALPPFYLLEFFAIPSVVGNWGGVITLVGAALSIAIVASLDALLCAKTVEGVTGHRT